MNANTQSVPHFGTDHATVADRRPVGPCRRTLHFKISTLPHIPIASDETCPEAAMRVGRVSVTLTDSPAAPDVAADLEHFRKKWMPALCSVHLFNGAANCTVNWNNLYCAHRYGQHSCRSLQVTANPSSY
jgi:hypothetical protein